MKTFLLLLVSMFSAGQCFAQKPLTNSRTSSYYTYIYKLSDEEVAKFYADISVNIDKLKLGQAIDSVLTDKFKMPALRPGNYLTVYASQNKLNYKLIENHSVYLEILNNNKNFCFALFDSKGNDINIAEVSLNKRHVKYDTTAHLYRAPRFKEDAVVEVTYNGLVNYFNVAKKEDRYRRNYNSRFWHDLVFSRPIKYTWMPFHNLFSRRKYPLGTYTSKYNGYFAFNKPKYKPGDTVKFKAFVYNDRSKEPIKDKELYIKLSGGRNGDKIIGKIASYRDGGFESKVVLNDSLKLVLDQGYNIALVKSPDVNNRAKNNQAISGYFQYEEYELKAIKFAMRADKDEQSPGNPVSLYFKATDENALPVADGRLELTFTTSNSETYKGDRVFVPDTLWIHKMQLDAVGETKLVIPDSIFPKADLNFFVRALFLNSSNEHHQETKNLHYDQKSYVISTDLDKDTLKIARFFKGKPQETKAVIKAIGPDDDTLSVTRVTLPTKIMADSYVKEYQVETDSTTQNKEMKDFTRDISLSPYRIADSIFVSVNNPRNIPFWYTVFSGNRVIDAGKATHLFYRKKHGSNDAVFFRINYLWGGEPKDDEVKLEYYDKLLSINVQQPISVSPGQQVPITVNVKNPSGQAVADADITAYAVTSKFPYLRVPGIPYFGKRYPNRKLKSEFENDDHENKNVETWLNWKRWGLSMGLDSIVYYQFTHTKDIFKIEEAAPDTLTQIAPFIVKKGEIVPIDVLFIDESPVYFSQAQQLRRYSFRVRPGNHKIKLRTANQTITLDNIKVLQGKKLIVSINADTALNHMVQFVAMPDTLTNYEADLLNRYVVEIVDNFGSKLATLQQGDENYLLNPDPSRSYRGKEVLAGPLFSDYINLAVKGQDVRTFEKEPGYSFEFQPGLIKQKSIGGRYPFRTALSATATIAPYYGQYPLTNKEVNTLWQEFLDERSYSTNLFHSYQSGRRDNGRLVLDIEGYASGNYPLKGNPQIKSVIIYKYDNPDFIQILPGKTSELYNIDAGRYRIMFLLKNDRYYLQENVVIKPYGTNYFKIKFDNIHKPDSVSIKIWSNIQESIISDYGETDGQSQAIKEAFNEKYLNTSTFAGVMTGQVLDKQKQALIGVAVMVKGTKYGTVTDVNGRFKIKVPASGKLTVKYIGYIAQDVAINPDQDVKIIMMESSKQLSEVAVVGYGTQSKRDLTGSLSTIMALQGRVPGVDIRIRGNGSISGGKPLYIIDGVPVESIDGLDQDGFADMSILKDAAATAIYGARAANGVVVVTTKKGKALGKSNDEAGAAQQQTLRTNFSDYAYWQPKLRTDEQGNAKFMVTFPDDITNWHTVVLGTAGKFTGYTEGQIKSFKSLSANMVTPQFAVKGDEMKVIGKIMNYTTDAVSVNRKFSYNGQGVKQDMLSVKNALIDTFKVLADDRDSLKFEYTIKKDNGYFDGERRVIPVFEQGVLETKGSFADLENDTTLTMRFDPALGKVTFRADASVLPALLDEIDRLRNYEYLCNEQLASKLKGLLADKRVSAYLGRPFKWNRNVLDIIKKLQENRRAEGTWGWWKDTDEELWISVHAIEALVDAEKEGYKIQLDKQKLIDYLMYQVASYHSINKLDAIAILLKLGAKADYYNLVKDYEKTLSPKLPPPASEKLKLMLVKQQAGLQMNIDSLLIHKRSTMFGNVYWGEDNYSFFDNSVQLSIVAYQILKLEGKHNDLLPRIRNYFLEQRKDGYWRNTYESSLILETILPELLAGGKLPEPSAITLSGAKSETVTKFPYTASLGANASLSISKTGRLPVYITGYQQFWNKRPARVSKDFTVDTHFEKTGGKLTKLKGGEPVSLIADVTARADADFVMVEIPIPAGCSYESKEQNYWGNEVHREYFKNKVSIFCRKLKQGKYTFTIKLMPRYGGNYTLNPAKVEMMYFPVFYGREDLKRVTIE